MKHLDDVFTALQESQFRMRFHIGAHDRAYVATKGMPTILLHARGFIDQRLAPAQPRNDGKQTPWRGHPVFVAQHATGTCCRGCLAKWHGIPRGVLLGEDERAHITAVLERWLQRELQRESA